MDLRQLDADALAHKAAGRHDQAIALRDRIAQAAPESGVAQHNLGVALADGGRWKEAELHFERAVALGSRAPQTRMMLGRCQQWLTRFEEAEKNYEAALQLQPSFLDAQRDLAQLRWMHTGRLEFALSALDSALRNRPGDTRLNVLRAQILEYTGDLDASYKSLIALAEAHPDDPYVSTAASQVAAAYGDHGVAHTFAQRATALAPTDLIARIALASALLGLNRAETAAPLVGQLRQAAPNDQLIIALQATIWRLLGDPRYRALYDYEGLVKTFWIEPPQGWPSRDAYLDDVEGALQAAHAYRAHPFGQSVRHGGQVPDVMHVDHPALKALPRAFDAAISTYIARLGHSTGDPVRARNTGGYLHQGMWSIRMEAGGFHVDHVHPSGWLSSACYIALPEQSADREGWIRFGQPGIATVPALQAEHYIRPERGKLVLFPSYMWHGTQPFTTSRARMTVAFDLTPAAR